RIRSRSGSGGLAGTERPQGLSSTDRSEAGPGMLRARSRFRPVYWVMRPITALLLVATFPDTRVSQTPPAPAPAPTPARRLGGSRGRESRDEQKGRDRT